MVTRFFDSEELAVEQANLLAQLFKDPIFRYVVVNVEAAPTTGRIHWQAYIELNESCRWTQIVAAVPLLTGAHYLKRDGTQKQAIAYCTKSESRVAGPFEHGTPAGGRGAGKVTAQTIVDYINLHPESTMEDLAEVYPAYLMMHYDRVQAHLIRSKRHKVDDSKFQARVWQMHILKEIDATPDDRHIMWVTDRIGGTGKSRLAKYLIHERGAVSLSGRIADMALIYRNNQSGIVLFDISRGEKDFSEHIYSFAENLKNGSIVSTKYQSESLLFPAPHVIVFSNRTWDRAMWSHDRVIEFDLSDPRWTIPPLPVVQEEVVQDVEEEEAVQFDSQLLQEIFRDLGDDMPPENLW